MSIQVLFQVLDVRTILECWKALVLDYTLVIVSVSTAVQFHVAEALKQLIFPFQWSNSQIQPCGSTAAEMIFDFPGSFMMGLDAEKFDLDLLKEELKDKAECAILHVDANLLNNEDLKLPKLARESTILTILNQIKNNGCNK